jgi:hypothetical protein
MQWTPVNGECNLSLLAAKQICNPYGKIHWNILTNGSLRPNDLQGVAAEGI